MTKEQQKQLDEMHTQLDRHGALLEKILSHLVVDIPTAVGSLEDGHDSILATIQDDADPLDG